ncbi:endonuclease III [Ferrimicrobium acidiphilum]|uniref:Endonuclease III n=2 Tax=Ferrimicrobium acidiphilum TaxID=121039 RepID=A0A0D8FTZ1_9ACTN|nr:endonuclease III [Ferrimicrobium acidiphilum]KJE76735.1 ultraviolet N-glycosylase/AP lyase [Ferrimicrobium acidiphilum DSM 19497]
MGRQHVEQIAKQLEVLYPGDAKTLCALHFETPFQLLVATVLSAQTTDAAVNAATHVLFARYPTPQELAIADIANVAEIVYSTGFYRTKANRIVELAGQIVDRYQGEVPEQLEELTTLPGVGRKTANVVRSVCFGLPGLPVDTHVARLSNRLGLSSSQNAEVIEQELCGLLPESRWGSFSLQLILHGRRICRARTPSCFRCELAPSCDSAPASVR